MDNDVKYYKVLHRDGTTTFYDTTGNRIAKPKDANSENVKVLYATRLTPRL